MSKTLAGTRKRISEPPEGIGTIPTSLAALNKRLSQSEPMVPGGKRAVLGEGPIGAELGFVGEQPGDQEDRQGHPFAGPAGLIFDRALDAAASSGASRTSPTRSSISSTKRGAAAASPEADGRRSDALSMVVAEGA